MNGTDIVLKICRELNWHPPFSLDQGLQATALAYLKR